jgi:repressor LexA
MGKLLLKEYREAAGITQQQLAVKTGIPLGTIQDWEQTGRSPRDMRRLVPIAEALGCFVDNLLGREVPKGAIRIKPAGKAVMLAYGRIAAGMPIEMCEAVEEIEVTAPLKERHPDAYILIVKGDSMNEEVADGHFAVIDPSAEVHNGDIAAVNVNGYDATLKIWHKTSNSVILSPSSTNLEHKDLVIDETSPEAPSLRILGKYIISMSPYRG